MTMLHNAEAMSELTKKLGLLERVRGVCESVDIPIPGIVVVGEQSAGKSSLLEHISGIQFPRAENTCTRMPCVLSLLTDATESPHALVSLDPTFENAKHLQLADVEKEIKRLTDEHAKGDTFISTKPIHVRVVSQSGPQLSLIDLPGVTHNSGQMANIHDVTKSLVEQYLKQEEMVILCVLPAMSDFGNAEVIKLAKKYDPEGKRTLGVVTKCDDAARAEASDIVEKVQMKRSSDVKLHLGFHCVVNRSQKNMEEGMTPDALATKEAELFTTDERLSRIPQKCWGTLGLTEKIGKIQAQRIDQFLPKIKEAVHTKLAELKREIRDLPPQLESEAERHRQFDAVLRKVQDDLQRRVRAEFMSTNADDKNLAIAPRVAEMLQKFRAHLRKENPEWLGEDMIAHVEDVVQKFVHGYTVDNLMGQQVFVNLVKLVFVEERLLAQGAEDLTANIANHLRMVVSHVIEVHSANHMTLASRLADVAQDVIDEAHTDADKLCAALAEAQQVTSTTQADYMVSLTKFRKSWIGKTIEGVKEAAQGFGLFSRNSSEEENQLTPGFVAKVKSAFDSPYQLTVLEICASLHVYSAFLVEAFTDMSAKLVKYNMVEKLTERLELKFRTELDDKMQELFPVDGETVRRREDLEKKAAQLHEFRLQLSSLPVAAPPLKSFQPTSTKSFRPTARASKLPPPPEDDDDLVVIESFDATIKPDYTPYAEEPKAFQVDDVELTSQHAIRASLASSSPLASLSA
jgi:GTP-binding protein EngB required for normal cell division